MRLRVLDDEVKPADGFGRPVLVLPGRSIVLSRLKSWGWHTAEIGDRWAARSSRFAEVCATPSGGSARTWRGVCGCGAIGAHSTSPMRGFQRGEAWLGVHDLAVVRRRSPGQSAGVRGGAPRHARAQGADASACISSAAPRRRGGSSPNSLPATTPGEAHRAAGVSDRRRKRARDAQREGRMERG